jgi:hypothetical protein
MACIMKGYSQNSLLDKIFELKNKPAGKYVAFMEQIERRKKKTIIEFDPKPFLWKPDM